MSQSMEETAYGALVLDCETTRENAAFSKAVLGLSGGIDSAVTACLAAAALGPENVLSVVMPARYSSAHSVIDAAALAHNLGIEHRVMPIDGIFQAYLGRARTNLAGRGEDVAEENLQARTRGAGLMAISNKFGYLLLSTGNKSELAVGYCTLSGDMAGGLAVINGVPKTLVYQLARFINRNREVIPASTLTKPPSAELRSNLKDIDTLPPYDVLDPIIEAYVERDLDIEGICQLGFDPRVVIDGVRRIDRSEYKRRQATPGLKISSKAFGVGRRYPMAADYEALMISRAVASELTGP
jgi:NAD+ synthase (glutamine-hydrolysing)